MRVLAALVACVAVALPAQDAGAAPHRHKAKHKRKHARPCKKSLKRKAGSRASRSRRRCKPKRRAPAKRLVPKRNAANPTPAPGAPLVTSPLGGGGPAAPLGRYLSVLGDEFSLQLSRPALAAGSVTLEFRNVGEDPHDLVLSPDDGSHTPLASFGETPPDRYHPQIQSLTLPAGRYYLFCSLPNHESLGMRAHLRVQ